MDLRPRSPNKLAHIFERHLSSPFFKIVIAEGDQRGHDQVTEKAAGSVLYIHKAVLTGLSPELEKHVNNEMKEGRSNTMVIKEVDCPTMEMFMEFAYMQYYSL